MGRNFHIVVGHRIPRKDTLYLKVFPHITSYNKFIATSTPFLFYFIEDAQSMRENFNIQLIFSGKKLSQIREIFAFREN